MKPLIIEGVQKCQKNILLSLNAVKVGLAHWDENYQCKCGKMLVINTFTASTEITNASVENGSTLEKVTVNLVTGWISYETS